MQSASPHQPDTEVTISTVLLIMQSLHRCHSVLNAAAAVVTETVTGSYKQGKLHVLAM